MGLKISGFFVADSFGGLPPPNEELYEADRGDRHHSFHHLVVPKEEVEENFRKYGLLDDRVIFLAGWFKDTLPNAPVEKLSLLRLDGDMYESTIEALQSLYHKLSVGGYCIIDDYSLKGCRQAVHDFLEQNHIRCDIKKIDRIAVYWRKEKS